MLAGFGGLELFVDLASFVGCSGADVLSDATDSEEETVSLLTCSEVTADVVLSANVLKNV